MIQRDGSPPVTLTLTVTNRSQSVACQINNPIDLLPQDESQVEVSIDLVWTNGSESFIIDQPQGALNGKLLVQFYENLLYHICKFILYVRIYVCSMFV